MKYKIVYNDCYGGYTLSYKAIDWLSEHGSEKKEMELKKVLDMRLRTKYNESIKNGIGN